MPGLNQLARRHVMRFSTTTLSFVLLSVLVATGVALAADDAPALTVDGPADGDWFTDPAITVEGTTDTTALTEVLNMSALGMRTGDGGVIEGGKLVYKVTKYFADEFTGSALNTTRWSTLGNTEHLSVDNGTLVIGSGGIDQMPLVYSATGSFPTDMDVPWLATFRLKYSTGILFFNIAGGGITPSSYSPTASNMAVWKEHFVLGYKVYANGQVVRTISTETPDWNVYTLSYNPDTEEYKAYMDGTLLTTFKSSQAPTRFWFGCPDSSTSTIFPQVTVDYARLWTFEGSWESEVVDMGGEMVIDDTNYNWATNAPGKGTITVHVAASADNVTWSPWIDLTRESAGIVEGRYLKFRANLFLPLVTDPSKRVSLTSIRLDFHYKLSSLEYDHNGAGWTPLEVNDTWGFDLTLVEDTNHLEVRVTDSRGVANTTAIDLILDTTAPTGTVEIDGGNEFTGSLEVTLTMTAEDIYGVPSMQISFQPDFGKRFTLPFCETMNFTLEGVDGPISIYVRFIDSHGLVSMVASDTINLDMTAPEGSVTIDGDAEHVSTDRVSLVLEYIDANGVASVEVANEDTFADAHLLDPGQTSIDWDLETEGNGTAWVYVRITDAIGNVQVVSDSIDVYIPKAEGTVTVEGGGLTSMPTVTLSVEAPEHLDARLMQVSEDADFEGAEWQEYAESIILILSSGDGAKTIYVRFEDFRGFHSLPISATVSVDTTAPAVTAAIEGSGYATDTHVTLTLSYDDDHTATDVWIGDTDDMGDAQRFDYDDTLEWTLPDVDGERTVHVWVTDAAGNSGHATANVVLATKAPEVTVNVPDATNADQVPVDVVVTDALGGVQVQIATDADPTEGDPWVDADGLTIDTTGLTDGEHTVHVRARNAAGLLSDVATATFLLDRTAPDLTILSPADGKKISPSKLALEVDATDGAVEYRIDGGQWTPMPGTVSDLDVKKGEHTVDVRVTDDAGNVATTSTTFTVEEGDESPGSTALLALLAMTAVVVLAGRRRWS